MDYGAHLPVVDFGSHQFSLERLSAYVQTARDLGFKALSTNDHLISSLPWLDAPTALAAMLSQSGDMAVGTSVLLPVVRGPLPMAKALAVIDLLSSGRLFVGVGPGSSARDYEIVNLDYQERWKRFDETIRVLRALWSADETNLRGGSTRPLESTSIPSRRDQVRRYGSAAGVPMRVCAASPGSETAGSRQRITRIRISSELDWTNLTAI
jgi:alkanesulfonate monooxygenase SsuD/methylene tetrahydromethanopterin reductase-like flavin-dependent oxidoreductase (luciferase family)